MTDALQSRRTFIKSAAALGTIAAVGLTGGTAAANAANEDVYKRQIPRKALP